MKFNAYYSKYTRAPRTTYSASAGNFGEMFTTKREAMEFCRATRNRYGIPQAACGVTWYVGDVRHYVSA